MCAAVMRSIQANPKAARSFSGGENELTLVWIDARTDVLCKARLDYYRPDLGVVFDLKSTINAREHAVQRDIEKYAYHVSAMHYMNGLLAQGLPAAGFGWVFVEKTAPFAQGLYFASADMTSIGRDRCAQYLSEFDQCSNQVTETETAPVEPKAQSIKEFLRTKKAMIAQALEGTALTPKRLLSITMSEMRKTPRLRECTRESLFGSMVQAAQLGLEPGSALGQCYLIPYKNKAARTIECQFQIGYKGMIALARRSGEIKALYAHCVHENDEFEVEYGLVQKLVHKPCLDREPGQVIGAYAVAHLVGGGEQFVYLPRHKLDKIRGGSKGGSIWSDHFEAMCQKSAARALFKWLPVSVEAMTAAALDEQADAGTAQQNGQVFGDDEKAQVFDHETGEILESHIGSAADLNEAL